MKKIKSAFLSGLLMLLPLGITFFILNILIQKIGQPASRLLFSNQLQNFDKSSIEVIFSIVSIFVVMLIITVFGWLSKYFFGKFVLRVTERLISAIPIISDVYCTVKQIVDTLGQDKQAVFKKAVLVEFPRNGLYSIGFLTNTAKGEVQIKTNEEVVNVFVPTTPNPTSGFLIMVPKDKIIELNMTIGDAMKVIISGGAVVPDYKKLEMAENIKN